MINIGDTKLNITCRELKILDVSSHSMGYMFPYRNKRTLLPIFNVDSEET